MATYFPGSNNGRDAAPVFYSGEALPSSYTESAVLPSNMMMYLSFSSGSYSETLHGNLLQQNSCINMSTAGVSDSNLPEKGILSNLGESRTGEHDLNVWRPKRTDTLLMHPMATGIFQSGQNLQSQGLSLTLGTQVPSGMQVSSLQYQNDCQGFSSFSGSNSSITGQGSGRNGSFGDDGSQNKQSRSTECAAHSFPGSNLDSMQADISPYGMSSAARTIHNSKYLKAAQQLLEEVVHIQKALKQHDPKTDMLMDCKEVDGETKNDTSSNPQESTIYSTTDISAAEKQNLQNKMTKLLSMLDEVDRRYKQYYHQMQIVVSSFDVIAGSGAAKPYTSLALQTISRHFRCLRDAINGQLQVSRRSLGGTDSSETSKGVGISRLRYVDQQLRQQRALQQLGMIQQHAWRPQRGLPQSSVSILRAWLFEHFLHPYPKDSDKIMLARQTGLTRSQVSNWFINARVRLWKPMVEEIYKEEIGDAEFDSNSLSDIAPNAAKEDTKSAENGGEEVQQSGTSTATERCSISPVLESKWDHVSDIEMAGICGDSSFRIATHGDPEPQCGAGKYRGKQGPAMINVGLFQDTIIHPNVSNEKLMAAGTAAFHMPQLGRFGSQRGVSLTLGLQQCEGGNLPVSVRIGTHQSFVSMRGEDFHNAAPSSRVPETTDFDCMDSGSLQPRFGSPHLLHDSVA